METLFLLQRTTERTTKDDLSYSEKVINKIIQTKFLRYSKLLPPTYNLKDADNVIIEGNFYEPELVQVNVLVKADEKNESRQRTHNRPNIQRINGSFW